MGTDPKLSEVIAYLTEFPGFDMACLDGGNTRTLRISSVQRDFIECTPVEDIRVKLAEFRLAPTRRDLGELPIAVTVNGCIFT